MCNNIFFASVSEMEEYKRINPVPRIWFVCKPEKPSPSAISSLHFDSQTIKDKPEVDDDVI